MAGTGFGDEDGAFVDTLNVVDFGGVTEGRGGGGGGRAVGFTVLHMGGCEVINHGGLGLFVVVVVAAARDACNHIFLTERGEGGDNKMGTLQGTLRCI